MFSKVTGAAKGAADRVTGNVVKVVPAPEQDSIAESADAANAASCDAPGGSAAAGAAAGNAGELKDKIDAEEALVLVSAETATVEGKPEGEKGFVSDLFGAAAGKAKGAANDAASKARAAAADASEMGRDAAGRAAEVGMDAAGRAAEVGKDAADRVAEVGKDAAGKAAEVGMDAAGKAAAVGMDVAVKGAELGKDAAVMAVEVAKDAGAMAMEQVIASKEKMKRIVDGLRLLLEKWAKRKLQQVIERVIDKIPSLAKTSLEDPAMPRCASRGKDRLVDAIWPDVREEILWEVTVLIDGLAKDQEVPDPSPVWCLRAFFRYHLFPHDKSIWGQLRDPAFICLKLIAMIPTMGVSPLFFLFVFFVIDKSDTFQLISFILTFKGTQFISMGVIRCLTGFFLFVGCLTAVADESEHACYEKGPGNTGGIPTLVGFILQVGLCWLALAMLPYSKAKGRSALQGNLEHKETGSAGTKGGYIIYFLFYDLVAFFCCLGACALVMISRPTFKIDDWPVEHALFGAQVVYGLLSFPFFFFSLPGLARVLTHAIPTAYDPEGRCVKPQKKKKDEDDEKRLLKDAESRAEEELVDLDEAGDMFGQMKRGLGLPV